MPSAFDLLQSAVRFHRSHPLLNQVVLWLIVLPTFAGSVLQRLGGLLGAAPYWPGYVAAPGSDSLATLAVVLLQVVTLWGTASVMVIAKRMLQSSAGRSRTSFGTVRRQAGAILVPLLLTDLLRSCITLLWTLLLVIPGIIYAVRTAFSPVVVVCEGLAFRDALNRSRSLVKGRTFEVFVVLVGISVLLVFPVVLLSTTADLLIGAFDPRLLAVADALEAGLAGVTGCLYALSLVAFYGWLVETADRRS